MTHQLFAYRTPLPCTVLPGGTAVVLADGRAVSEGSLPPGEILPREWQTHGRRLEAVLFPATAVHLSFDVSGLFSAEGVPLALTVSLGLRLANAARALADLVRDAERFAQADLQAQLADAVRTGLVEALRRRTLAELEADPHLRAWLCAALESYLDGAADLGRSGLAAEGVDAYDLRCRVWDVERQVAEECYLRAALAGAEAAGRRLLDARLAAELRPHLVVKEELVDAKERMAGLVEREAAADWRLDTARAGRDEEARRRIAAQAGSPSQMRPELWRVSLGEPVSTAPLADAGRVYVATAGGRVQALDRTTGRPAWPSPAALPTKPGDGMALAAGCLWVPGRDGILYGLDPGSGAVAHRVDVGGPLSSAPLAEAGHLYLSTDVAGLAACPGRGQVVAVDPAHGQVVARWPVCDRGLRAQPVVWGSTLYVGDRSGVFYAVDLPRGRVDRLFAGGGRILAAACVDREHRLVIVGDSYGRLLALDRAGREEWAVRLGGAVSAPPLLHAGRLFVGADDGRVHALDPATGRALWEPYAARAAVAAQPVAWRDLLFVGSRDGYLYALEAASGRLFWQYYSGSAVGQPPALGDGGHLYAVDQDGHLNALRWCLARYAEAARRVEEADPPRWGEAVDLWLLARETEAAFQAAEHAGRLDLVADLAMGLNWFDRAAQSYQALAVHCSDPVRAARWYVEAADAWTLANLPERARNCLLLDARKRGAPLLTLRAANCPPLVVGQADAVQVCVANCTDALARDVILTYSGHVKRADQVVVGTLGPNTERLVAIEVVPTESGSATLEVVAHYADSEGREQRPIPLQVRLKVGQPAVIHQHFYGPHIGGDGVILQRGERGSGGRRLHVQSGEGAVEMEGSSAAACPACGAPVEAGQAYCTGCGADLAPGG